MKFMTNLKEFSKGILQSLNKMDKGSKIIYLVSIFAILLFFRSCISYQKENNYEDYKQQEKINEEIRYKEREKEKQEKQAKAEEKLNSKFYACLTKEDFSKLTDHIIKDQYYKYLFTSKRCFELQLAFVKAFHLNILDTTWSGLTKFAIYPQNKEIILWTTSNVFD